MGSHVAEDGGIMVASDRQSHKRSSRCLNLGRRSDHVQKAQVFEKNHYEATTREL